MTFPCPEKLGSFGTFSVFVIGGLYFLLGRPEFLFPVVPEAGIGAIQIAAETSGKDTAQRKDD